jgi:hypothetical protein
VSGRRIAASGAVVEDEPPFSRVGERLCRVDCIDLATQAVTVEDALCYLSGGDAVAYRVDCLEVAWVGSEFAVESVVGSHGCDENDEVGEGLATCRHSGRACMHESCSIRSRVVSVRTSTSS